MDAAYDGGGEGARNRVRGLRREEEEVAAAAAVVRPRGTTCSFHPRRLRTRSESEVGHSEVKNMIGLIIVESLEVGQDDPGSSCGLSSGAMSSSSSSSPTPRGERPMWERFGWLTVGRQHQ